MAEDMFSLFVRILSNASVLKTLHCTVRCSCWRFEAVTHGQDNQKVTYNEATCRRSVLVLCNICQINASDLDGTPSTHIHPIPVWILILHGIEWAQIHGSSGTLLPSRFLLDESKLRPQNLLKSPSSPSIMICISKTISPRTVQIQRRVGTTQLGTHRFNTKPALNCIRQVHLWADIILDSAT